MGCLDSQKVNLTTCPWEHQATGLCDSLHNFSGGEGLVSTGVPNHIHWRTKPQDLLHTNTHTLYGESPNMVMIPKHFGLYLLHHFVSGQLTLL